MKIEIVFTGSKNEPVSNGKSFTIQLANMPSLNEYITFDYIEEDETLDEMYEVLTKFRTDEFKITEIYHYCAINKLHQTAALLFVSEPLRE